MCVCVRCESIDGDEVSVSVRNDSTDAALCANRNTIEYIVNVRKAHQLHTHTHAPYQRRK